jgi:D-threo-aldose 1-dehydrogenase
MNYLPLLFLHDPERITFEGSMAPDGAVPALVRLKEEGVVGHLGIAGGPVWGATSGQGCSRLS